VPYTLLLADDSVTIQRVIELTFADEDVTVVAVGDGDQAIAQLEASPPDIVLADVGMPGRNGYEVAQYIRRSPNLSHIPVVLLTGAFEPVDQARADDAGCNGVLAKPFEPQLVISRVKELLAHPGGTLNRRGAQVSVSGSDEQFSAPAVKAAPAEPADISWAPQPTPYHAPEPLSAGDASRPGAEAHPDLTDYFDQLDAAFAKVKPSAGEPTERPEPSAPAVDHFAHLPAPPAEGGLDWYASAGGINRDEPPAVSEVSFAAVNKVDPVPELAAFIEAAPHVDHASGSGPDDRLAPIEASTPVETESWPAPTVESPSPVAGQSAPAYSEPAAASSATSPAVRLELPLRDAPPLPHLADAFAALLAAEQGEPVPAGALWPASEPAAPAPAAISEETIETITRRVLETLSDSVVRQAVAEITSTIAERVIREEIERIKTAIK
jgi:CheY-like chemotaxis protein